MIIRAFYVLSNGVYKATLQTEDWSEADQNLMAEFGEPEIDLGGSFTGPPAFTLSNVLAKIMTESPFTESFDSRDFPSDAEDRADVWAAEIIVRMQSAVSTLRALTDDFTREETTNV